MYVHLFLVTIFIVQLKLTVHLHVEYYILSMRSPATLHKLSETTLKYEYSVQFMQHELSSVNNSIDFFPHTGVLYYLMWQNTSKIIAYIFSKIFVKTLECNIRTLLEVTSTSAYTQCEVIPLQPKKIKPALFRELHLMSNRHHIVLLQDPIIKLLRNHKI